jgi:GMP synthase-like glutamine amidotransferase
VGCPQEKILSIKPKGFILSGGPKSVYEENAPFIQKFILESGLPILGICYGMQALTHALGGKWIHPPIANMATQKSNLDCLLPTNCLLFLCYLISPKSGCLTATK